MKKLIALAVCTAVLFGCLFNVSAETQDDTIYTAYVGEAPLLLSEENPLDGYSADLLDLVSEKITDTIVNYGSELSIISYGLTVDAFTALCQNTYNLYPEIFLQTDCKIRYSYYSSGLVIKVAFNYLISQQEFLAKKDFYFSEIKRIVSTVPDGLSDLEKVIYINDYLAAEYTYDTRALSSDESQNAIHDAYGFLREKTGVCQSYALTFLAIMRELGIECRYAYNSIHAWNIVKLGESYYHVDCTHNDPLNSANSDFKGSSSHSHLLVSDDTIQGMADGDHTVWSTSPTYYPEITCTDTTYDSSAFVNSRTPFVYYNGFWYTITYDKTAGLAAITKWNRTFTEFETLKELNYKWPVNDMPGYIWQGFYSGLVIIGNTLYYNNYDTVFSYNLDTDVTVALKQFEAENSIYSCYFEDGKIKCVTALSPNDAADSTVLEYDIGMGDLNCDGFTSAVDLSMAKRYLLGVGELDNWGLVDLIHDNHVDILDYIRLKKIIAE